MRVDCYNASECPVESLEYGDTFYYRGDLYIKVNSMNIPMQTDACAILALSDGLLCFVKSDTAVILADTKVVVNIKETF